MENHEASQDADSAVSRLISLKRYELPPAGYHESVLREFRRRQRAALLKRPWYERVWEDLGGLWPTFQVPKVAYGALLAVAVAAGALVLRPSSESAQTVAAAAEPGFDFSLTPKQPVTIGQTLPVSSRTDGSQHYVLQPRPASNERPLSF